MSLDTLVQTDLDNDGMCEDCGKVPVNNGEGKCPECYEAWLEFRRDEAKEDEIINNLNKK